MRALLKFRDRRLEQPLAAEPVEVEAEPAEPVQLGELGLPLHHAFVGEQIVVAEFSRFVGLIVTFELRRRRAHFGPLGEARAPPVVVLRDRMKLRQVKRDRARRQQQDQLLSLRCAGTRKSRSFRNQFPDP